MTVGVGARVTHISRVLLAGAPAARRRRAAAPPPAPRGHLCASIIIPTRDRVDLLRRCIESLVGLADKSDFEVIVVDNSGKGLVRGGAAGQSGASVIEPGMNVGFGAAINVAFQKSKAPYVAALNDDAAPRPKFRRRLSLSKNIFRFDVRSARGGRAAGGARRL